MEAPTEEASDSVPESEAAREAVDVAEAPPRRPWYLSPPVLAFGVIELVALRVWLSVSRGAWFDLDEWDFLVQRKAGDPGDLFRSHNGHWTTFPILAYRFLYWTFGLRTYLPYRLLVIVLYLAAAALLRVVLRRAGVNPWIATAVASLYAFFGAGWFNIIRGFQITLTGSLVCGLAHLLLADHDGPVDRRDVAGIILGFVGLLTSGLAVVFVAIVGVVVLLRRGWRVALLHTVPFAVTYVVWAASAGRRSSGDIQGFGLDKITGVVRNGLRISFKAIAPAGYLAIPLLILLVGGFALAVVQRRRSETLGQLVAPIAMLVSAPLFLAMSAAFNSRSIPSVSVFASQSRYVSIVALFMLPALAVAADAVVRQWRLLLPLAVILFVVAIPHNVHVARTKERGNEVAFASTRRMVLTLPRTPAALEAPRTLEPERIRSWRITVGWLLDAVAQHRIPAPAKILPFDIQAADFRLAFDTVDRPPPTTDCVTISAPRSFALAKGDVIGLYNNAVGFQPAGPKFPIVAFGPEPGKSIVVLREPGSVIIGRFRGLFFPNPDSFRGLPKICIEHAATTAAP